ncbi:MAG: MBL fold metallo-hydrolase [Candidatus Jorgensenbacteria bacterium]
MTLTKFGHCCMLIEEQGLRILTDPGNYTTAQNEVKNIDVVLITHEHADHLHIESLKEVLANNPQAKVITNRGVGAILDKEGIPYTVVDDGKRTTEKGVLIEGLGKDHAEIYKTWKTVENTSYFIGPRLFYPGDAFYNPHRAVEILALPVAGPWCKISECVDYGLLVKPKKCFPVHDGNLNVYGTYHRIPATVLAENGIEFFVPELGKALEL